MLGRALLRSRTVHRCPRRSCPAGYTSARPSTTSRLPGPSGRTPISTASGNPTNEASASSTSPCYQRWRRNVPHPAGRPGPLQLRRPGYRPLYRPAHPGARLLLLDLPQPPRHRPLRDHRQSHQRLGRHRRLRFDLARGPAPLLWVRLDRRSACSLEPTSARISMATTAARVPPSYSETSWRPRSGSCQCSHLRIGPAVALPANQSPSRSMGVRPL